MRILVDSTVLVRAHQKSRALARRLLHKILENDHRLVLSNELIAEVVRVLRYPKMQALYGLSDDDLLEYTLFLQSVADIVHLDPRYPAPRIRDRNDAHVLQAADLGEVELLCTFDRDFYEDGAVVAFCAIRNIEVCDEETLLRRLHQPGQNE